MGQEEELTLANEGQQSRVSGFIRDLRDHKDTVSYFELTLDSLLEYVILPERDRALFVTMMMEQLGLPSSEAALADYMIKELDRVVLTAELPDYGLKPGDMGLPYQSGDRPANDHAHRVGSSDTTGARYETS